MITMALAGNPNSGKTTLFNGLTGANHYVGNWAGVTVEKKEGSIKFGNEVINIVDLPGTYSLSPYSIEEKVARNFIMEDDLDVVINIVDATNLERNLYLTLQLIELGKPVVIALNMMDEVEKNGDKIDVEVLSEKLGVPVVPISARHKSGLQTLLEVARKSVKAHVKRDIITYDEEVLTEIMKIETAYFNKDSFSWWHSIKVIENDLDIIEKYHIKTKGLDLDDLSTKIVDSKYKFIESLLTKTLKIGRNSTLEKADRIDKIVLNKWLGIPIFVLVISTMFYATFNIGSYFVDYLDIFINEMFTGWVRYGLEFLGTADWLVSMITDGIIAGVGGVLVFVPNIAILFLTISMLEDSGYMSRIALIMDRWMQKVGLNGKTFIPMILGFGCNVPAIMGTRTLENEKDRMIAILINPFMSCGARLPVYSLFASVFFPGNEALVVISLYFLGIIMALLVAKIFRKTLFKGSGTPFVMELPPYRLPEPKALFIHVWDRVKDYITKAGTVIFAASIVLWVITNYNFAGQAGITESFGAMIGRGIAPVFKPLGFGTWEAALSLLSGLAAKEIVVANLGIIYGIGAETGAGQFGSALANAFTQLSAYAFMVFVLLYTPCVAVVGVIKRETNSWKWAFFSVVYQLVVAWFVAMLIFQVGSLLGF